MNLENLREHHGELLSFMESKGYAEAYIRRYRLAIRRILSEPDQERWLSYTDIYLDYARKSESKNYRKQMRIVIGAIEQFDVYGRMPDARHRHTLFERGSYHLLVPEFKELIDFYREHERQCGKREMTISGQARNTATFLHHLQERGAACLSDVTEDAVLSFFVSETGNLIRTSSLYRHQKQRHCTPYFGFRRLGERNDLHLSAENGFSSGTSSYAGYRECNF